MAARQWFYREADGMELGPFSGVELRRLVQRGQVRHETLVRTNTSGGAIPAGQIRGLFPEWEPHAGREAPAASTGQTPSPVGPPAFQPRVQPPNRTRIEPIEGIDDQGYARTREPTPINPFAIASLICGIFGLAVPVVGAVAAIVTGHIALKQLEGSNGREEGKLMTVIGLVLGYIQAALWLVATIALLILGVGITAFLGSLFHHAEREAQRRLADPPKAEKPHATAPSTPPFPSFRGDARGRGNALDRPAVRDRQGAAQGAARAFEFVQELGGQIGYDRDFDTPGIDRFLSVLSFPGRPDAGSLFPGLTDAGLARLKTFPMGEIRGRDGTDLDWPGLLGFQKLVLADTSITDEGVAQLHGMKRLEYLDLAGTEVTDAGLAELLPTLPRLRVLILGDQREAPYGQSKYAAAGVTDRGMAEVGKTKTLQHLRLSGVAVTDAGLATLAGLEGLERLNLNGTKVTDAGLVHVRAMRRLNELSIANTNVTDAGLVHLADHPRLLTLVLSQTAVSDAGLAHLASMPMMRVGEWVTGKVSQRGAVFLAFTDVTDAGLTQLRERLTKVTIYPERALPRVPPARAAETRVSSRNGFAVVGPGPKRAAKAQKKVATPEEPQAPPSDLKGSWDVTGPRLNQGYVIEFGADGRVTVRHKLGVSRISAWSYRDGSIHLGGSIRVNEIRLQGPWKARWNGADEIDVIDPNGQALKLKRRTP